MRLGRLALFMVPLLLSACSETGVQLAGRVAVPPRFPDVAAPKDNPITQSKVELGMRLFFENKLSGNDAMSCASCHDPLKGFSNGEANAMGITGERGNRNVPTIYTAGTSHSQFWDGRAATLEEQALGPIENPIEMNAKLPDVVRKLAAVPYYRAKFREAFGTEEVNKEGIAKALASFERALNAGTSRYDRFLAGDKEALSEEELEGLEVFRGKGNCNACHDGPDLKDAGFDNIGVGMTGIKPDLGRFDVTKDPEDRGAFKTPTLRNIGKTGPYMHDGSMRTLEEVVEHYDVGGTANPQLSDQIVPLKLTEKEEKGLLAFLKALDGEDNLTELAKLPGLELPGVATDGVTPFPAYLKR